MNRFICLAVITTFQARVYSVPPEVIESARLRAYHAILSDDSHSLINVVMEVPEICVDDGALLLCAHMYSKRLLPTLMCFKANPFKKNTMHISPLDWAIALQDIATVSFFLTHYTLENRLSLSSSLDLVRLCPLRGQNAGCFCGQMEEMIERMVSGAEGGFGIIPQPTPVPSRGTELQSARAYVQSVVPHMTSLKQWLAYLNDDQWTQVFPLARSLLLGHELPPVVSRNHAEKKIMSNMSVAMLAVLLGNEKSVRTVLAAQPNPLHEDIEEKTILDYADVHHNPEIRKLVWKRFQEFARQGCPSAHRKPIPRGRRMFYYNVPSESQFSAYQVQSLIHHRAYLDQFHNSRGETLLMYAASYNLRPQLLLLLGAGAKTAVRNKNGQTALDVALEKNHVDVVAILQAAGAPTGMHIKSDALKQVQEQSL